ncbi:hypothetical protein [Maribacter aestuarii]|uniref:hypothetical protein n=1 Tax=Maribacter aestuarii TaxID=1130723 RepID=UPI00248ACF9F|nr:hypothetical protein [Maribacter aestuarii]
MYQRTERKLPVTEEVLFKSITYFDYKNIGLVNDSDTLKNQISTLCNGISFTQMPFDMIYADESSAHFKNVAKDQIHNNSMLLIKGIYNSKENVENWKGIKKMEQVRITVDLFYCGIVFFRKEQAKEHFRIRI